MNNITTILVLIIGVAIVAVVVSKNAQTVNLINAMGDAFNDIVKTAVSPVKGTMS